ncbi:MAG TPA: HPP family protein [Terriglobia bacterium]|nr:HPP family protein [Terriglobia bacterium]
MGPLPPRTPENLRSHFESHEAIHVFGLIERLRMTRLLFRYPPRFVWAAYVLITCFISIALISALAVFTGNPFVFPSLGPTAYLLFFTPLARASSPRHALLGHAIGLACGYLALYATGTLNRGAVLETGVNWPTVIAAASSLSATGALMVLLRVSHPPAGATTLIVSLGLIAKPIHLLMVEAAVFLLVVEAFAINRLAGLPYPWWEDRVAPTPEPH